jgi:hypothetical protein
MLAFIPKSVFTVTNPRCIGKPSAQLSLDVTDLFYPAVPALWATPTSTSPLSLLSFFGRKEWCACKATDFFTFVYLNVSLCVCPPKPFVYLNVILCVCPPKAFVYLNVILCVCPPKAFVYLDVILCVCPPPPYKFLKQTKIFYETKIKVITVQEVPKPSFSASCTQ